MTLYLFQTPKPSWMGIWSWSWVLSGPWSSITPSPCPCGRTRMTKTPRNWLLNSVCWAGSRTRCPSSPSPTSTETGGTAKRWELWWTTAPPVGSRWHCTQCAETLMFKLKMISKSSLNVLRQEADWVWFSLKRSCDLKKSGCCFPGSWGKLPGKYRRCQIKTFPEAVKLSVKVNMCLNNLWADVKQLLNLNYRFVPVSKFSPENLIFNFLYRCLEGLVIGWVLRSGTDPAPLTWSQAVKMSWLCRKSWNLHMEVCTAHLGRRRS